MLKQPTGELIVSVNHNQLRTMASETVDPIDRSHPSPHTHMIKVPAAVTHIITVLAADTHVMTGRVT